MFATVTREFETDGFFLETREVAIESGDVVATATGRVVVATSCVIEVACPELVEVVDAGGAVIGIETLQLPPLPPPVEPICGAGGS